VTRVFVLVCAVLAGLAGAACKINLEHAPDVDSSTTGCAMEASTDCADATMHQELGWLETNVFGKQCTFSGCHNGGNTDAGKLDLRAGKSFASLVNVSSRLEPSRKLVVPGNSAESYLLVMVGKLTPAMASPPAGQIKSGVGTMPQDNGGMLMCCQKLDAIDRWIGSGAMNN